MPSGRIAPNVRERFSPFFFSTSKSEFSRYGRDSVMRSSMLAYDEEALRCSRRNEFGIQDLSSVASDLGTLEGLEAHMSQRADLTSTIDKAPTLSTSASISRT
jgi:hypothetical protein